MCPPAALTPIDVDFAATDAGLFGSLERMIRGSPLPSNVINDVNPYNYLPSNLPDGVWYLVCSKENTSTQNGKWKTKGEACEIFSTSVISGWKTTLEFYEGQAHHECKTDWVMQEFRITQKRLCENKKAAEDSSSLCRVFLTGKETTNHEKQQIMISTDITGETYSHSTELSFEKAKDDTRQGSTSKPLVNDDNETRTLAVMDRPTDHPEDNQHAIDLFSEGDYLELWDLEYPASPSSSSDNSSCMTMSSDEYFDTSGLLQDLEPKSAKDVVPENAEYKYSFTTSHRPNEVVMFPGSLINVERSKPETAEIIRTERPMPGSAMVNRELDYKASKPAIQGQKADYLDEGSSSSHDNVPLQNGGKKDVVGRVKKLKRKYLCFMPF